VQPGRGAAADRGHDPRRPRTLNPDVDAELEPVLLKSLARSPAERYASAGELASAMAQCLNLVRRRSGRWLPRQPAGGSGPPAKRPDRSIRSAAVGVGVGGCRTSRVHRPPLDDWNGMGQADRTGDSRRRRGDSAVVAGIVAKRDGGYEVQVATRPPSHRRANRDSFRFAWRMKIAWAGSWRLVSTACIISLARSGG